MVLLFLFIIYCEIERRKKIEFTSFRSACSASNRNSLNTVVIIITVRVSQVSKLRIISLGEKTVCRDLSSR